jgi:hypothetical protein
MFTRFYYLSLFDREANNGRVIHDTRETFEVSDKRAEMYFIPEKKMVYYDDRYLTKSSQEYDSVPLEHGNLAFFMTGNSLKVVDDSILPIQSLNLDFTYYREHYFSVLNKFSNIFIEK